MLGLQAKAKMHLGRYAGRVLWAPYLYGELDKTRRSRVDCLEPNFVSPETIELPACSPKPSSNGSLLYDLIKAEGGDLLHAEGLVKSAAIDIRGRDQSQPFLPCPSASLLKKHFYDLHLRNTKAVCKMTRETRRPTS